MKTYFPESVIQRAILQELRFKGYFVVHIENENPNAKNKMYNFARMRNGVTPGIPDLCVFLKNGKTIWFEIKSNTGRLSQSQREFHDKLNDLGHSVFVIRDITTAINIVQNIDNIGNNE